MASLKPSHLGLRPSHLVFRKDNWEVTKYGDEFYVYHECKTSASFFTGEASRPFSEDFLIADFRCGGCSEKFHSLLFISMLAFFREEH